MVKRKQTSCDFLKHLFSKPMYKNIKIKCISKTVLIPKKQPRMCDTQHKYILNQTVNTGSWDCKGIIGVQRFISFGNGHDYNAYKQVP